MDTETGKTNSIDPLKIPHFVINLEYAEDRRKSILAQSERLGLDVRFVKGAEGPKLTAGDMAMYNAERRAKEYPKDLTPNEIGCYLSHIRALRAFVDSGEPYGVILEDDSVFADQYVEKLGWLLNHVHGWGCLKLCSENGPYKPITEPAGPYNLQITAHRQIVWLQVACLYTHEAAKKVVDHLQTFWKPADPMIAHSLLLQKIPFCTCMPNIVSTSDPTHENSCIDSGGQDRSFTGCTRTLFQYLRYRLMVMRISNAKKHNVETLRKTISVD